MKKFSDFLSEAAKSRASDEAQKRGLEHVGYGYYGLPDGTVTHRSLNGKLVELSKDQQAAKNGQPPAQESEPQSTEGEGEGGQGAVSITFGRFNPPTIGHQKLIDRVAQSAKGGEYKVYPSRSQDPKKNPIDPETKVHYMRQMYPDHAHAIINNEEYKTIFDVLKGLYSEGYSEVNIVVGGDRVAEFDNLANKYNGKLYEFEEINVVSAGDRDPDSEGVDGMSASKMRKAAADNDFATFRSGIPEELTDKETKELFNEVRSSMQMESFEDFADASYILHEIAPKLDEKSLREHYYNSNAFPVGSFIENVNTGIIGKVVNRGANYVIYIDEHDTVYRGWLKDLTEKNDIHGFDFTPQGLIGTSELSQSVVKMTPGQFIQKINKRNKVAAKT
jgi:hypothetical protein